MKIKSLRDFRDLGIYGTIFKPKLNRLYLISHKSKTNEMYLAQIDLGRQNGYTTVKIKLDAFFFEIDNKDGNQFYFIEDKIIYKMDFSIQESTFGGIFSQKSASTKDGNKNLYGAVEFFRSKYELEFVRFDDDMKNFFINEGKTIKMLELKTLEVKKIFEQQDYDVIDVFVPENFEFLYSFHMHGEIIIWNMENEQFLSSLKGASNQPTYRSPVLLNYDKNLGVHHDFGIDIWQLEASKIERSINDISNYAQMHFLEDGEHFMLEFDHTRFYLIEVDTFRIIKEFLLPENTIMHKQLSDGDLMLVLENKDYDPVKAKALKKLMIKNRTDAEVLMEIPSVREVQEEFVTTPIEEEPGLKSQLRSVLARNNRMNNNNNPNSSNVSSKSLKTNQNKIPNSGKILTEDLQPIKIESDEEDLQEETADKKDKKDIIPKLIMEKIDDDEEEMNSYNVNSVKADTTLSMFTPTQYPFQSQGVGLNHQSRNINLAKTDNIMIKIGQELYPQEIDHTLFKYRIVRLVQELYLPKNDPSSGLFTLFQTDSDIMEFDSILTNIEKSDDDNGNRGLTDKFDKMQSRIKQTSKFAGKRDYKILVGLRNQDVYKVSYKTTKLSVPIPGETVCLRIFRNRVNFNIAKKKNNNNSDKTYSRANSVMNNTTQPNNSISESKDQRFLINNLKYVHDHQIAVAVSVSDSKSFNGPTNAFIQQHQKNLNIMAQHKNNSFCETKIPFDQSVLTEDNEKFFIGLRNVPKSKSKNPVYQFFMYSSLIIATFEYRLKTNCVIFNKFLKKESASRVPVRFSKNRQLFYIPINSQINIWDATLTHFIYQVETTKPIDETILLDDMNLLLIYDRGQYYELDLDEFRFRRVISCSSEALESFRYLVDFTRVQPGQRWSATFHTKNKHELFAVPFSENLNLKYFPFEDLLKCFLKRNYKKFIQSYAEYYYEALETFARKDFHYGPLNPLLFAIYHNDSNLLEDLLDRYYYPKKIENYVSPLEYAFALNYRTAIKVLCNHLIRRDDFVHFSRADFKHLLKSDILTCHKLIATIPSPPEISMLPKLVYMPADSQAIFHEYLSSLLIHIKKEDMKYSQGDEELEKYLAHQNTLVSNRENSMGVSRGDYDSQQEMKTEKSMREVDIEIEKTTRKYLQVHKNDVLYKSEVVVNTVPFKYNYSMGTEDSVTFIYNYSKSKNQDFILSDWREIVKNKWATLKRPYISLTLFYFAYMSIFTLSSVIQKDNKSLKGFSIFLNIIMMIFEIIQMITYFSYRPSIYFKDTDNYVDWINFIGTLTYSSAAQDNPSDASKVYNVIILILVFYRGFSYLRIFDAFTTLIGMVNIIVKRLLTFFILLLYTYFGVVLLMVKLGTVNENQIFARDVYYWILLGSIEDNAFETPYSAIPVIGGSIFVTIVLMNMLIAYLSNLFSRLEEQQKVQELKEKAALILDMEVMVMFFRYSITGKIKLRNQYEFETYKRMLKSSVSTNAISMKDKQTTKNLKRYLKKEKYLYVFRILDMEKGLREENIYQKIKSLNHNVEELNSLVSKRSRSQEAKIEVVRKMVKSNSTSQEKTIDDLKKLMYENSKNVSENTESMLVGIDEQQRRIDLFLKKIEAIEYQIVENNKAINKLGSKLK